MLDHDFDGIREYDQRLPNWWLFTLYGAIVFSVAYWFFYFQTNPYDDDVSRLAARMKAIEQAQLEASVNLLSDEALWKMSRNPEFVEAGRKTFMANCKPCHGADLKGGIGFNLVDDEWVHGGTPMEVYHTVSYGVDGAAMQAWRSILGSKRIAEVVAFVMSHHELSAEDATLGE